VLAKGLDSGTAFEILSIDIADVDIGDNVGREAADRAGGCRQTRRAGEGGSAPRRGGRGRAGDARADAGDARQSRRSRAQVPNAMADAFRSGNLGIMDYVRMKNVEADTSMRTSIAGGRAEAHRWECLTRERRTSTSTSTSNARVIPGGAKCTRSRRVSRGIAPLRPT
jgi:uncharacterized protein YqfA (UPF0365 family)